jgi:hypothetical protein
MESKRVEPPAGMRLRIAIVALWQTCSAILVSANRSAVVVTAGHVFPLVMFLQLSNSKRCRTAPARIRRTFQITARPVADARGGRFCASLHEF